MINKFPLENRLSQKYVIALHLGLYPTFIQGHINADKMFIFIKRMNMRSITSSEHFELQLHLMQKKTRGSQGVKPIKTDTC